MFENGFWKTGQKTRSRVAFKGLCRILRGHAFPDLFAKILEKVKSVAQISHGSVIGILMIKSTLSMTGAFVWSTKTSNQFFQF